MAYEEERRLERERELAREKQRRDYWTRLVIVVALAVAGLIGLSMWGIPIYGVWQQRLAGEAELRRAEQNRQIKIQEAQAVEQSANHLKMAEITRAEGVAKANQIIGSSLRDNEDYLLYLWIHNLAEAEKNGAEVIYVPTEANLPILEAGRRLHAKVQPEAPK